MYISLVVLVFYEFRAKINVSLNHSQLHKERTSVQKESAHTRMSSIILK